jgi:hypothetical protein
VSAMNIADMNNAMIILGWVVLGLAASGLYEGAKSAGIITKK